MTFRPVIGVLLLCSVAVAAVPALLTPEEFVTDWKQSKQFTMDVAKAMPAQNYTFRASPEEMTFGEQMRHVAVANVYRFHEITGAPTPFDVDNKLPADKEAVVRMLDQSFDYVIGLLPNLTEEQLQHTWHIPDWPGRTDPTGRAMILNMFVHTAHHRAQCEVYMRIKGVKPPVYRF